MRLLRLIWFVIRLITPWVVRILIFALMLVLTALGSIRFGIPKTVDVIASDWVQRALNVGFPTLWERNLYFVFLVLAYATVIAGWIVLAFITVFIVKWIF